MHWPPPDFWPALQLLGERAVIAAAIFLAFWIAARILQFIICRLRPHAQTSSDLMELLGRTAKISLIIFGLITALGTVHVNVSALVAGLGLTGFALGFALRDVLSNLLAGVLILLYRPFGRGDHISVTGLEGRVMHIDLRYTTLDGGDKTILIPNSNLFTNPITVDRQPSGPA
ncbi:MAG TPA: mechanosensitive ion channel domain-containing protein [Bryobacteraceae bacterium]|jgi:small-conductance mechanosensitive channel|nr:mechanosensitive ion channel domain-containing protein [Bryobacteraceae bacterium]